MAASKHWEFETADETEQTVELLTAFIQKHCVIRGMDEAIIQAKAKPLLISLPVKKRRRWMLNELAFIDGLKQLPVSTAAQRAERDAKKISFYWRTDDWKDIQSKALAERERSIQAQIKAMYKKANDQRDDMVKQRMKTRPPPQL